MGPYSHLSTTPSDGFGPSKLLQTTLPRRWGLQGIFQQPLPMALAFPSFFKQPFRGHGAFHTSFNNPFLGFWDIQASPNNPFRKVRGLPSEAIPHGKPFRAEGSFERKALGCQMVLSGPEMVQNGTKTDLAAIFQQPLTKVLGLPSNPFRGYGVFQASFNNPFRGSRSSTKSDGLPPFQG